FDPVLILRRIPLFGFAGEDEKLTFDTLLTASGVGPKLAQAMLAVHSPDELRRAVSTDDVKTLTAVPGIGQKGAQRIILELKDRIGSPVGTTTRLGGSGRPAPDGWESQVQVALVTLGYLSKEADRAIATVAPEAEEMALQSGGPDVAKLLRAALSSLSKARS
ncbi:MAG: Holliday junction branch migration protein RuvA, partial [Marmoricola sp.]